MTLHYPIGQNDFRVIREIGLVYVDKTRFIRELLDLPGFQTVLLCRPRRFGKTINLSTLRYFFERSTEDRSALFDGLEIMRAGPMYRQHFQRYPVITLTFKGIKETSWSSCHTALRREVTLLYEAHREAFSHPGLTPTLQREAQAILAQTADDVTYRRGLKTLSQLLYEVHGERVVILIDEHDEPIRAGYLNGFLSEVVQFFRTFFGEGLKDNPALFRAVVTGITRTARENIFSDLNNLGIFTLVAPEFRECFGFTEAEVERLLERASMSEAA